MITPTTSSLGRLDPSRLSRLDAEFQHVAGDKPSKEVFMHRAFYRARPDAGGDNDHVGFHVRAVRKHHAVTRLFAVDDLQCALLRMDGDAQFFYLPSQPAPAPIVNLRGHTARSALAPL